MRLVVRSRRTWAHLEAADGALLVAVDAGATHRLSLVVDRRVDGDGAAVGALPVEAAERDALPGVTLRPMTFTVSPDLPSMEAWNQNAALLARLRRGP